jgi:aldose 1-epimerase
LSEPVIELEASGVTARVEPAAGGRLSSLSIDGQELLVGPASDPLAWGAYPMVPFAGRVRGGMFDFGGTSYTLPARLGDHAIHGYGFESPWETTGPTEISWSFAEPWPFAGHAVQRFELTADSFTSTMEATAAERQPLMLGWHPWFLRRVGGHDAELELSAGAMYELDGEIPTGRLVAPPPGPWDNCFTELARDPVIRWGPLSVRLSSTADHWVVYDEPAPALCVEPQTGAPDEINRRPHVVEAGDSIRLEFTIDWSSP